MRVRPLRYRWVAPTWRDNAGRCCGPLEGQRGRELRGERRRDSHRLDRLGPFAETLLMQAVAASSNAQAEHQSFLLSHLVVLVTDHAGVSLLRQPLFDSSIVAVRRGGRFFLTRSDAVEFGDSLGVLVGWRGLRVRKDGRQLRVEESRLVVEVAGVFGDRENLEEHEELSKRMSQRAGCRSGEEAEAIQER